MNNPTIGTAIVITGMLAFLVWATIHDTRQDQRRIRLLEEQEREYRKIRARLMKLERTLRSFK